MIAQLQTEAASSPSMTILTTICAFLKSSRIERSTTASVGFMTASWHELQNRLQPAARRRTLGRAAQPQSPMTAPVKPRDRGPAFCEPMVTKLGPVFPRRATRYGRSKATLYRHSLGFTRMVNESLKRPAHERPQPLRLARPRDENDGHPGADEQRPVAPCVLLKHEARAADLGTGGDDFE